MSETGEYCTRCYSPRGLGRCADCVIQDLGFTREMVAAIKRCAEFSGPDADSELAEQAAGRIEALLAKIT